MNKLNLSIFVAFVILSFNCFAQPPAGYNCQFPYIINSLPFTAQSLDSQTSDNIYSAGDCSSDTCDMDGKDFVMTYTSPYDQYVNIATGLTWQGYVGLWVFNNCPDQPNSCVAHATSGMNLVGPTLNGIFLSAGITYYFVVSTNCQAGVDYVTFNPSITEVVHDGGVNLISAPLSSCGLSNNEAVSVILHNFGSTAISNFPVKYKINNNAEVVETYSGSIAANANANFTFATLVDFSVPGIYTLKSYSDVLGDHNAVNDTVTSTIVSAHGITSFPYQDNFDDGITYWTVGGVNPSWEIRHPVKQFINQTVTDTACFVTNGTGLCNAGEDSYIESPCFDMTLLANPVLEMLIWYENAPGGTSFMSSTDNGTTWQNVMANTTAVNWYNASGQWSGSTHKWVNVKRSLSEFIGQSSVRFRITLQSTNGGVDGLAVDNFNIVECSPLPTAGFTYNANGTTVNFQNNSLNGTTYYWNFGDGSVSTQGNASHTYATTGNYIVKLMVSNACGSDTIEQTIDVVTGLNSPELSGFSIHPNPATDKVFVSLGNINNAIFELSDIQGKSVIRKNIDQSEHLLMLENLDKGVYFVKINSSKIAIVRKLVIE